MRHLTTHEGPTGFRYYWTPPSKLRALPNRPPWLKSTPLGGSLPEAITEAEKLNARLDQWRGGQGSRDPMSTMLDAYLTSQRYAALAPRTREDYRRHLDAIRADFAGSAPDDVSPVVVHHYREGLARSGLSARQITYRLQVLRLLFAFGKQAGHTKDNPASQIQISMKPKRAPMIWTAAGLAAAMSAPYPAGLAATLALFTLQRQGDLLALRWDAFEGSAVRFVQSKTGKTVVLPVHSRLKTALDAAPRRGDTVLAHHGKPYTTTGFNSIWRRNVPEGSPRFHDIRRTAVTWLRAGGLSGEDVMLWTGHGRQGEGAILDVYDLRLGDLAAKAFPVMDRWGVQDLDSSRLQPIDKTG